MKTWISPRLSRPDRCAARCPSAQEAAILTIRNLDDEIVRRLRAAEHGRSAEAEHCAILQPILVGSGPSSARQQIIERLAEFRRRTPDAGHRLRQICGRGQATPGW